MAGVNPSDQHSPSSDQIFAISGRRKDIIYPPEFGQRQVKNEGLGLTGISVMNDASERSSTVAARELLHQRNREDANIGPSADFGTDQDLSCDFMSIPSNSDSLAVGCFQKETILSNSSCLRMPPFSQVWQPTTSVFESAPDQLIEENPNEQASVGPSRPHTPEQDTSPHLSMEQGNSAEIATSESMSGTQYPYSREEDYRYPDLADLERRLQMFTKDYWPHKSPSAQELAEAGFFYDGRQIFEDNDGQKQEILDQVVCYKCGKTFRQWRPGDDPVLEHKRVYYDCFKIKWKEENN